MMFRLFSILLVLGWSATTFAAEPVEKSPAEIIALSDRARGNVDGIEWVARLTAREQGRTQERTLKIQFRDDSSLAEFTAPRKVKGRMLLMKDRNMWFIKPGLRKPVPISPRQKLMGGASNGDIASTDYAGDYRAKYLREEAVNGKPCYLFDLKSIHKHTTYDRILYWVNKHDGVAEKAEFYTVSGKHFKTAVFEYDNRITIDGQAVPFISKMTITNAVLKSEVTTMTYHDVEVKSIPTARFNLNLLAK